jgi:transcriptional regulator with XRE-family HTH domain
MDNDSIKQNLLKLRLEHNLSQGEMADVLGIARNTYRNIEKGSTKLISDTVMKVAGWAGVTPEEIVLGYAPAEKSIGRLKDAREQFNTRIKDLTDDYEMRLERLRCEIDLLKDLNKEKDDNIRTLKSMVTLLEKRLEDNKID